VRQRVGVGQVVDRYDIDAAVTHRGAHDVAADAAEPVDPDFHSHRKIPPPRRSPLGLSRSLRRNC
jgi:hypothetical protein